MIAALQQQREKPLSQRAVAAVERDLLDDVGEKGVPGLQGLVQRVELGLGQRRRGRRDRRRRSEPGIGNFNGDRHDDLGRLDARLQHLQLRQRLFQFGGVFRRGGVAQHSEEGGTRRPDVIAESLQARMHLTFAQLPDQGQRRAAGGVGELRVDDAHP